MNRINKAWRSLGAVRQVASMLLMALMLFQAVLLVVTGWSWLLPFVALLGLLGIVQIKQSAATRDTNTRRTDSDKQVKRLARINDEVAHSVALLHGEITRERGLLREKQRHAEEQQAWLRDRVADTKAVLDGLGDYVRERAIEIEARQERVGAIEREIHAAVGNLPTLIAGVGEQLTDRVHEARSELSSKTLSIDQRLAKAFDGGNSRSLERRIVAEISALNLLHESYGAPDLPAFDSWAMSPLTVRLVRSLAWRLDSESMIVELGSGISTAWIAYALSQKEHAASYVAIDHSVEYAAITEGYVESLDVSNSVEIVVAPLRTLSLDGEQFTWYETAWIAEVTNIGLLVVDGPPAGKDARARVPALPLLIDRLADKATIIVDDYDRPGESDMVAKWQGIPGITRVGTVGRSLILSYSKTRATV